MKKLNLIFGICLLAFSSVVSSQDITPEEIVEKADNSIKGETSQGTFTMRIVRPDYTRELTMESWNEGNDKALIVVKAPPKEAGNKTLKIGNEMWQYLQTTETTMKLPASMLLQSWNGSDLTNDDLVRETDLSEDYKVSLMHEEKIAGEMCWKLELVPNPDVPVVWGKIYYWVRKKDYLPALVQYYDEAGKLIRSMKFESFKNMSGRFIPTKWVIVDEQKKGHYTEFIYNDVQFDVDIPARKFSFRELEK